MKYYSVQIYLDENELNNLKASSSIVHLSLSSYCRSLLLDAYSSIGGIDYNKGAIEVQDSKPSSEVESVKTIKLDDYVPPKKENSSNIRTFHLN